MSEDVMTFRKGILKRTVSSLQRSPLWGPEPLGLTTISVS